MPDFPTMREIADKAPAHSAAIRVSTRMATLQYDGRAPITTIRPRHAEAQATIQPRAARGRPESPDTPMHPCIEAAIRKRKTTARQMAALSVTTEVPATLLASETRIDLPENCELASALSHRSSTFGLALVRTSRGRSTFHAPDAAATALIALLARLAGEQVRFPLIHRIGESRTWQIVCPTHAHLMQVASLCGLPQASGQTGRIPQEGLALHLPALWPWIAGRKHLEKQSKAYPDLLDPDRHHPGPWLVFSARTRQFVLFSLDRDLSDHAVGLGFSPLTRGVENLAVEGFYTTRHPRTALDIAPVARPSLIRRLVSIYNRWPFMPETIDREVLRELGGGGGGRDGSEPDAGSAPTIQVDRRTSIFHTTDPEDARLIGGLPIPASDRALMSPRPETDAIGTRDLASVSRAWTRLNDDARGELIALLIGVATPELDPGLAKRWPLPASLQYTYDAAQEDGIRHVLRGPTTMISDDMGTGKTVQACGAADTIRSMMPEAERPGFRALFVVPPDILQKWTHHLVHVPAAPFTVVRFDNGSQRSLPEDLRPWTRFLPADTSLHDECGSLGADFSCGAVYLIPISQIQKLSGLLARRWDLVVIDEGHGLSKSTAERTGIFFATDENGTLKLDAGRLVQMTGTDITNTIGDYYHIVNATIRRGAPALAPRITEKDFVSIYSGDSARSERRVARLAEAMDNGPRIRRLKIDIYPDLPPKLPPKTWIIPCTPSLAATVAQQEKLAAALGLSDNIASARLEADHRRQMERELSGSRLVTARYKVASIAKAVSRIASVKEPVLLYSHHTEIADALGAALLARNVDVVVAHGKNTGPGERFDIGTQFNAGRWTVLCTTIAAFYAGHDVVRTRYVFFAEMDHKSWMLSQCQDRAWRRGQKRPVSVRFFVVPRSYDDILAKNIIDKTRLHTIASGDDRRAMTSLPSPETADPA